MRTGLISTALVIFAAAGLAQRFGGFRREASPLPTFPVEGEFHFIRVEYNDLPQYHRGFGYASRDATGDGWWIVDWPDSDYHFTMGLGRLTRIDMGEPRHMRLTDDRLFDHPWLYATQTGYWGLTNAETKRLGEYLLRGGFLVVDDFWGADQWDIFRMTMERALPGAEITDLMESDSVMHVVYDIRDKDRTYIPGTRHLRRGPGGTTILQQMEPPAWRAIHDPKNRVVVAVNFNTDVGDAWEYADSPDYPEPMTTLAYHYGVNYVVYAMTH